MAETEHTNESTAYPLPPPSDTVESGRLDDQHSALKLLLKGLYPCPDLVEDVLGATGEAKSILDLGCGTGAWCLDMAQQFPDAQIVGLDLVPQPPQVIPSNCKFESWNINNGFSSFYGQFDLVHMRFVYGLVDHHASMVESVRCLKPGGLIILVKPGPMVTEDRMSIYPPASTQNPGGSWFQRFWFAMQLGGCIQGTPIEPYMRDYAAGFWDHENMDPNACGGAYVTNPIGPWATAPDVAEAARLKTLGEFWQQNLINVHIPLDGAAAASGRSRKDLDLMHKRIDEELETTRIHTSVMIRYIWGRTLPAEGVKKETVADKNRALSTPSNDQGAFQVVTEFRDKDAWIEFNKNLMSTMNSELKSLWEIPNYDPIEV